MIALRRLLLTVTRLHGVALLVTATVLATGLVGGGIWVLLPAAIASDILPAVIVAGLATGFLLTVVEIRRLRGN